MKSIIIYYSLTGNTKIIARAIHQGVGGKMDVCEISTMKEVDVQRLKEYDLIGLGSPVWGGVPENVKKFIDGFPQLPEKYTFAFSTHASLGQRFFEIIEMLKNKGLTVIGICDWYAGAYRPNLPVPYLTDGHPDEIDIKEAVDYGKEMAGIFLKIKTGGLKHIPELPLVPEMPPRTTIKRPAPKYNKKKCSYPECRLCMDNCPVSGIDLAASPPKFAKPCLGCHFCEMVCPTGAVEVDYAASGDAHLERMKTVFVPYLAQAEAQGHFRRLVPMEKIGWDTPYYKVHNRHPRYVIPLSRKDAEELDGFGKPTLRLDFYMISSSCQPVCFY